MATKAEPAKQKMPWETEPGIAKGQSPKFGKNLAEALNLLRLSCKGGSCSIYEWFCRIHLILIGLRFCSDGNQSRTCEAEDAMGNRACNSRKSEPKIWQEPGRNTEFAWT